jgi:hypothetical protein
MGLNLPILRRYGLRAAGQMQGTVATRCFFVGRYAARPMSRLTMALNKLPERSSMSSMAG